MASSPNRKIIRRLGRVPERGKTPAVHPFGEVGSGCPNRWVLQAGAAGQITGFQTENASKNVSNPVELESTFQNAWDNSDAIFVEIYEQRFWEAEVAGPVLNPNASGRTINDWGRIFFISAGKKIGRRSSARLFH